MTVLEKAALAILREAGRINNPHIQDDVQIPHRLATSRVYALRYTRAVIESIREPTDAVICAADEAIIAALNAPIATDKTPGDVAWKAGIDAILAEESCCGGS